MQVCLQNAQTELDRRPKRASSGKQELAQTAADQHDAISELKQAKSKLTEELDSRKRSQAAMEAKLENSAHKMAKYADDVKRAEGKSSKAEEVRSYRGSCTQFHEEHCNVLPWPKPAPIY